MKRFDAVATRPYTTKDGEAKKQYVNIGRAVEFEDGGISIELTCVPVGDWWNGKIALYPSKPRNAQQQEQKPQRPPAQQASDFDDEIPF